MQKTFEGKVVSLKTPKTAIVLTERKMRHPVYQKVIMKSKKFKSHYVDLKIELGDDVIIKETKPISKEKYFEIIKVLKNKAKK